MESSPNRRNFLKVGMTGVGLAVLSNPVSRALASATCGITPAQTAGPFYPGEKSFHLDNDLTRIAGQNNKALGQVIYVKGQVMDAACAPLADVNVEIWQACASGKYNNKTDTNTASLDPNFKYWGETQTDSNGKYIFKTILPGAYPADVGWIRPPHIHFKVSKLGYQDLITQLYFRGNPLNDQDLILQKIPTNEQSRVVINFQPASKEFEPGSLVGNFDISIASVR